MGRAIRFAAAVAASAACAITAIAQNAGQHAPVTATVGTACRVDGSSSPADITTAIPVDALRRLDAPQRAFRCRSG